MIFCRSKTTFDKQMTQESSHVSKFFQGYPEFRCTNILYLARSRAATTREYSNNTAFFKLNDSDKVFRDDFIINNNFLLFFLYF